MTEPGGGQDESREGQPLFDPGAMGRQKPLHEAAPSEQPPALTGTAPVPPPPPPPPTQQPPVAPAPEPYPMRFDVDYPERLSRLSTFFRGFLIIPVWFFLYLVQTLQYSGMPAGWLTVFFRKRYPRWLFAANTGALGFEARAWSYAMLLTDRYPSFDTDSSPVTLQYDEPVQGQISRWRVFFWKGVLLIPHFVVLSFLMVAVAVVVFISWWAIMFTGRYPRGMFGFVTGAARWYFRVLGYFASFNDRFPPFALSAEAGPASNATVAISGIVGALAAGGMAILIGVLAALASEPHEETVDYSELGRGVPQAGVTVESFRGDIETWLAQVDDPGDVLVPLLDVGGGERAVVFEWRIDNLSDGNAWVRPGQVRLKARVDGKTESYAAALVVVGGEVAPASIDDGEIGKMQAVFIIPRDAVPTELLLTADFLTAGGIRYEFR